MSRKFWDRFDPDSGYDIADWTRSRQFEKNPEYPRFFIQYCSRLLQVSHDLLDELSRRVTRRELIPNDYFVLDRLKKIYDFHLTDSESDWLKDQKNQELKDFLR